MEICSGTTARYTYTYSLLIDSSFCVFNFMLPPQRENFAEVLAPDKSLSGHAVDPWKKREVGRYFKKKVGSGMMILTFRFAWNMLYIVQYFVQIVYK